jgi:hypothetical protein
VISVVLVHRQADLLEVAGALRAASCLATCLYRRHEQARHHADDRNHDQELDQTESASS